MSKVNVRLENCYGIKSLSTIFDFTRRSTYAVYSPNGTMKTSFARTFMDHSQGIDSSDFVFPERTTARYIEDELGNELDPERIFVIEPYNKDYESKKLSTLLVNEDLKERYDQILDNIHVKKNKLITDLMRLSGLKKDIEETLSLSFTESPNKFHEALMQVNSEVIDDNEPVLGDVLYVNIFTEKIIAFIETKDFKKRIEEYIEKYDKLVDSSTYFRRGVFNHNNASVVARNLKDNGFFSAQHSVLLNANGARREVNSQSDLEEVINKEKDEILNNPEIVAAFELIDSKLKANKELRDFRDYLIENRKIVHELANLGRFKQKLWISYLKKSSTPYIELEKEYREGKNSIELIIEEARLEKTSWQHVIDIFSRRFSVPFKLSIENQEDVILRSDGPHIVFTFSENLNTKSISKKDLLQVLSQGEKRALYILNIIFEVEARKARNQKTLFIVDDIADSFDYKNKFAIIEYLSDISTFNLFDQIIFTHNFDFYRTVCSRLDMCRENKLNTITTDDQIVLTEEKYQNNPFLHWKEHLVDNRAMLIASIPFVRNIADYCGDNYGFTKLTSLLHIKCDTHTIKISDLEIVFKSILKDQDDLVLPDQDRPVLDVIFEEAEKIANIEGEELDLEGKIVLAIAIRLKAEEHMKSSIDDQEFFSLILSNQTFQLYNKYLEMRLGSQENKETLGQVILMTPENIHINAFMYEPILDMSKCSLIKLYFRVKNTLSGVYT